jgi:hypothetical protein|tara:strand:- start:41 stop:214 length:174 start_codon:yes stop_codon:yes gene_type:complete
MLINASKVKKYALENAPKGKKQISRTFLEAVDFETRQAINRRLNHHDNKCGGRKTLV